MKDQNLFLSLFYDTIQSSTHTLPPWLLLTTFRTGDVSARDISFYHPRCRVHWVSSSSTGFQVWHSIIILLSLQVFLSFSLAVLVKEKHQSPTLTGISSHLKYIYLYFLHWFALSCHCFSVCHDTCSLCLFKRLCADVQVHWEMITIKKY